MSGDTGLGRLAHQRMFNVRSLRKGISSAALATVSDDYVFGSPSLVNTTNLNWPLIDTSVSLNTGPFKLFPFTSVTPFSASGLLDAPNQSATKPVFFSIGNRIQDVSTSMGRQYELDLISSGEATFTILDSDEAFNPSNPNSPYYPNVKIYRQIADMAMWPPVPSGGNVNLLNVNSFPFADPTFESYATGFTTIGPLIQTSSANCSISTTNPFAGSNCLALGTPNLANQLSYITFTVPCIPGQKYTTSVYVRTDTAFYVYMSLYDGNAMGTDMNVAATYTRLQVTFTATKPVHMVMVATDGTTNTGGTSIRFDNLQHECGGVANPFSTSGPSIYGLFTGFVERWPSNWNFHGTYGMAQITATDAFANLANQTLNTELYNNILLLKPDYYWPLNEASGATTFGDQSGNGGPSLILTASKNGAGTFTADAGTASSLVGDKGGNGVQFTQTGIPATGYYLTAPITAGSNSSSWGVTIIGCMSTTFTPIDLFVELLGSGLQNDGITISPQLLMLGAGVNSAFDLGSATAGTLSADFVGTGSGTYNYSDGIGRMFAVTLSVQGNVGNISAYTNDPVSGLTHYNAPFDVTATFGTPTPDFTFNRINVLGDQTKGTIRVAQGGIISHIAVWRSVVDVTGLMRLTSNGFSGDRTDQRILEYIRLRQFALTNLERGLTTLGPSSLGSGTACLDIIQAVAVSENGNFFADGFGVLTFQSRNHRYVETSAKFVFGENAAGGEIPYTDDISFDYDPTLVVNSAEVDQVDGSKIVAIDEASQDSYGVLTAQVNTNTNSLGEVADYANWIVYTHAQPAQRISGITINPAANPALWPVALGAQFGDRVTVKRRTSAGYTMQADYFIERVERSRDSTMSFTVAFQLSPAVTNGQPWIIEDPTFGVLDSTTVCGF